MAAASSYEDGYVQGVRDCAAWSVQSAVRVERLAIALETLSADLARQARDEVANAQKRWAENADLRDEAQGERLVKAARKGRKKPKAEPGPTLSLAGPEPVPVDLDAALSDEERMRRAAGRAWRA